MGRTWLTSGWTCLVFLILFQTGPGYASENEQKENMDSKVASMNNSLPSSGEETAARIDINMTNLPDELNFDSYSHTTVCRGSVADIVFVLDESGSVGHENFNTMKTFIIGLLKHYDVGSKYVRVGLMTFSSETRVHFHLNRHSSYEHIARAIKHIPYHRGKTNTEEALTVLRNTMFRSINGDRDYAHNIGIIITDGRGHNLRSITEAAYNLKKDGVNMFSIGVGGEISMPELNAIASYPRSEHVFAAKSYKYLKKIQKKLWGKTCQIAQTIRHPRIPTTTTTRRTTVPTTRPTTVPTTTRPTTVPTTTRPTTVPTTTKPTTKPTTDCDHSVADILFILDSSISVADSDMTKMFKFVARVVEGLDVGPYATHIAVTLFASTVKEEFHLNKYYDKPSLIAAILRIKRLRGFTETADALIRARTVSFQPKHGDRENVQNIIVFITDGTSSNRWTSLQQAQLLQELGVVIFAIGVGGNVNQNELSNFATDPKDQHVFNLDIYAKLDSIRNDLIRKLCKVPTTTRPTTVPAKTLPTIVANPGARKQIMRVSLSSGNKPTPDCYLPAADILFVLDSSGSVSSPNFKKLLKFVAEMVDGFAIGTNTVRVGVTLFANEVIEKIHLNQYHDKTALKEAIKKIERIKGATNTGEALMRARTISLQPEHGDRPDIANIVIVITDGKSDDPARTAKEADELRKTGSIIFSIGVGHGVNEDELKAIANGPDKSHVFQVRDFKVLKNIKKELTVKTCEAEKLATVTALPTTIRIVTDLPVTSASDCDLPAADILFVLDSSGSVSTPNFQKLLKFVNEMVDGFVIGTNTVRVGVTIFATKTIEKIHLNQYHDKTALKEAISKIERVKGGTNTAEALMRARTISLQPEHGERPDIPNIVIVMTDGKSRIPPKTAIEADLLRKSGCVVFSVGIGHGFNVHELKAIATGPGDSHVFTVTNFLGLDKIKRELAIKTCKAKDHTFPPIESTVPPLPTAKKFTTSEPDTTHAPTEELTTFQALTTPGPTTTCNKTIADIIFALDTSASVSPTEFKMMLIFVQQMIKTFDVGEDNVRVGVVTFSGDAGLQFHLNKYFDMDQLLDAVLRVKYQRGSTNTADALRYIRSTSFLKQNGNRDNIPNIVIVITDGKSNVPVSTAAEAAKLKRIATVFSIGVGMHKGYRELKAIATDALHIFTVDNFEALSEIKNSLAIKTCQAGKEKKDHSKCPRKADIVFILDTSGSVGERNFKKILTFVQSVSKHFNVNPDEVQIGVDTFDSMSRSEFNMNQYKDSESLLNAISKIPVHSGQSNAGEALKRLREQSMTAAAGARPNVTHIGILITDGRPTGPSDVEAEAKKVKEAGIKLLALGIGPGVNYPQLDRIAYQPTSKFVFTAENFDALKTIEPLFSQKSCKAASVKEEIVCPLAADIVFVLDSSASIGKRNFKTMLSFANSMVSKFQIGPQAIQVGMLRYNSRNYLEFNLNKYKSQTELHEAINNVPYTSGNSATGAAISFMHYHMFARASGFRKGVPKIAIVLTDGKMANVNLTSHEANAAQKDGITMFAIGIGSKVNDVELELIASKPSDTHTYSIKDFLALESIVDSLANQTCTEIPIGSKPIKCHDKIPRCHEFKPEVCTGYPRWSYDFCPEYCGLCFTQTNCIDLAPTCNSLDKKHCVEYPAWSRENCAKSCGFCEKKGNKTEIGDKVYTCSYKGKKYQTGESWKDGCEYECSCLDSERGMYTCWNRCPVYYNLPPQCKLVNIDGKCCKEPVCNFNAKMAKTTGHKRGKRFGVDVCVFDDHEYYEGQSWSVGCVGDCTCRNAKSGFYTCTSRCPHYNYLPSNCQLVSKAGQCCKEIKCEFDMDFGKTKGHGEVVKRANPVTSLPCVDKRPCEELSIGICHAKDLEFWVVENCARFCNKCPTPSVPTEGACLVDGKVYKAGETWKPSCSVTCTCEDGHHGIARCFNKCAVLPNLPPSCRKVKKPGECCEKIICSNDTVIDSQKLNNTIDGVPEGNQSVVNFQRGCMYKGSHYEHNQVWADGCEWVCQCGYMGQYSCSRRCPTFKDLPPSCHLESFSEEPCCQIPVCTTNTSVIIVPTRGKGLIGVGKTIDPVLEGCIYDNSTYQEGEEWIDECKYFCKCLDGKRGNYVCNERCEKLGYVPDGCHIENDPKDDCCEMIVCDAVTAKPKTETTPAPVGKCYYKGQAYNQGDSWYDECSLQCFCEDAQTGYFRCNDRCNSFSSIPADCTPKPDPKDPKCCKIFECGKTDIPRGLIGIKHGFGKSLQPVNKYKDKCVYKQKLYKQGDTWDDGCEESCECLDAKQGRYRCHTRCPRYDYIPPNCDLVWPEKETCCPNVECSIPQDICEDQNKMCEQLGPNICRDEYKEFANEHCHKTCGLCTPMEKQEVAKTISTESDCKDLVYGCADFEMDVCSEPMFNFAFANCRRFCNYCDRHIPS